MSGIKKKRKASVEELNNDEKDLFLKAFFTGEIPKSEKEPKKASAPVTDKEEDLFALAMKEGAGYLPRKEEVKKKDFILRPKNRAQRRGMPDATIDLHGMMVPDALKMLENFLQSELGRGSKTVLVIHGKGAGVLRDAVWSLIEKHAAVIDFQVPPAKLGGGGALIVRLNRKPKSRRNF